MRLAQLQTMGWKVPMARVPILTQRQWWAANVLGAIFILMAILQLLNFNDFRDGLNNLGLAGPTLWGVCIILAELWAGAGLFKWRLSYAFRMVSLFLVVVVAGFWFIENIQAIANGIAGSLGSSYFFGHFLNQQPGWWTVAETTIVLFLALYVVGLMRVTREPVKVSRQRR